jgi:hypothetical protein
VALVPPTNPAHAPAVDAIAQREGLEKPQEFGFNFHSDPSMALLGWTVKAPTARRAAGGLLDFVLRFRFFHALPLHVRRIIGAAALERHDVIDYLRALFTASEGYYRVIVFTVTDVPFGSGDGSMTSERATSLLARGFNPLPQDVSARPLPANYALTGLVYEFQREQGKDPVQLLPSHLDAKTHLVASGLWAALGLNP